MLFELGELLGAQTATSPEVLGSLLIEREQLSSTAIPGGVALPHCRLQTLPRIAACVGLHRRRLPFGKPEYGRVRIFVGVVSPWMAAEPSPKRDPGEDLWLARCVELGRASCNLAAGR